MVEVCRTCSWNHLVKSYVLGAARPARPTRPSRPPRARAAPGRRATAPARPVNNEGQQDQSAADTPNGSGAAGGPNAAPLAGRLRRSPGSARRPADHDPAPGARSTRRAAPSAGIRSRRSRPPWTAGRRLAMRDALGIATAASRARRCTARPTAARRPSGGRSAGRPSTGAAAAEAPAAGLGLGAADRLESAGAHQLEVGPSRALRQRRGDAAVADRHLRDGLLHRRHPQARRHPHQPGLDDPGQRRLRAGENRSARRQSGGRQHRPGAGACAPGGDRRRGPQLLLQPGLLVHRVRACVQEQHLRRRHPGRCRRSPSSTSRTRWWERSAPASAGSSARPRNSSSRPRCRGSGPKTTCCRPTSTSSTSAAAPTASRRRRRPTSASRSNSSPSPTARCWPR